MTKKHRTSFRVRSSLIDSLKKEAEKRGITPSQLFQEAISSYKEKEELKIKRITLSYNEEQRKKMEELGQNLNQSAFSILESYLR